VRLEYRIRYIPATLLHDGRRYTKKIPGTNEQALAAGVFVLPASLKMSIALVGVLVRFDT